MKIIQRIIGNINCLSVKLGLLDSEYLVITAKEIQDDDMDLSKFVAISQALNCSLDDLVK